MVAPPVRPLAPRGGPFSGRRGRRWGGRPPSPQSRFYPRERPRRPPGRPPSPPSPAGCPQDGGDVITVACPLPFCTPAARGRIRFVCGSRRLEIGIEREDIAGSAAGCWAVLKNHDGAVAPRPTGKWQQLGVGMRSRIPSSLHPSLPPNRILQPGCRTRGRQGWGNRWVSHLRSERGAAGCDAEGCLSLINLPGSSQHIDLWGRKEPASIPPMGGFPERIIEVVNWLLPPLLCAVWAPRSWVGFCAGNGQPGG